MHYAHIRTTRITRTNSSSPWPIFYNCLFLSTAAPYSTLEEKNKLFAITSGWGHTGVIVGNSSDGSTITSIHLKYLKVPLIKTTECEATTEVTAMDICAGFLEGKVIINKSRVEESLLEQPTIECVFLIYLSHLATYI